MKYLANSIQNHISKKVAKLQKGDSVGHRMLIMIPAMPEKTLLSIADALASYCLADSSMVLTLKIAKVLTDDWTVLGRNRAQDQGWVDTRGNLTYYRNLAPIVGKLTLVILCGTDRVTDSAGLADFHTCDLETIWQGELAGSFRKWVEPKLQSIGIHPVEVAELNTFDRLLKPILDYGRGDLLQISDWLENLNLNSAADVLQVQQAMLIGLSSFGLPSFLGFPLGLKKKSLAPYIERAGSFFSYTFFLEARERDKAINAIDKILEARRDNPSFLLDDENVWGPYSCGDEFLEGLKNYILTDDKDDRRKLFKCDFVTILDKVLKYKEPGTTPPKGLRKVSGSPVEMVLTAVWYGMRDFYRDKFTDNNAQITEISIKYDLFKHDVEGIDDEVSDSAFDSVESARIYLSRLIGGLDDIITKHLSLSNIDGQDISVKCSLVDDSIPCRHSRTAEPQLEFSIYIHCDNDADAFRRKFAWRLPEIHSYRLSDALLCKARDAMANHNEIWKLPVFNLPYYDELLRGTAADEIRRILLHSLRDERPNEAFLTNLLSDDWLDSSDSLLPKLKVLAEKYHLFINASAEKGLLGALLHGTAWTDLRRSYTEAYREIFDNVDALHSPSAGMLLRSFLVIQRREPGLGVAWHADYHEQSAIMTVLHPALLEMLEAQVYYLVSCFNYAVNREIEGKSRREAFKPHIWRSYTDLSEIQAPLSGLLHNEELNLDTNVRGQELIHRIGSPASGDATLSTRLLLNYGDTTDEDEMFSDSEVFRETSESKLLLRLMLDYFRLHPHARDGLSLAVFRNKDIQPIIAAVHQYLSILADPKNPRYYVLPPNRRRPYAISVTFFTESSDDVEVTRWIEQWHERWEAAETETKYQPYRECRFAVAHRLVDKSAQGSFQKLINDNFEADIAVFYDFIRAGSGVNRFENVPPFDPTTRTLKFPILEKACCTISNPAEQYKRSRVISNRQFVLGTMHANLMHSLKNKSCQAGTIVVGTGDFAPWRSVIDALHLKTEWVICIDPNMDERLLKKSSSPSNADREIIGFGSGVGTHGEDNYTISTEQFSLNDVHSRVCASIQSLYAGSGWSNDECRDISTGLLKTARQLSGLSLVRATGVDDQYIRDFMAYALSRKLLRTSEAVLCDNLISLDAYRHWFDLAENSRRPDLMWLKAIVGPDKRLHLEIQLVECKMALRSEEHLLKARSQVNNGLNVLMPAFASISKEADLEDTRPDRRYWWMQLHRLIASKSEINRAQQADVLGALERLAEGDYDISWNAAVFAFWTDSKDANIQEIGHWKAGGSGGVTARIYAMGNQFVKQLATDSPVLFDLSQGLRELVVQVADNICDTMEDSDLPPCDEEYEEEWDEENASDSDEENTSELEAENTSDAENTSESDESRPDLADNFEPVDDVDHQVDILPSDGQSSDDKLSLIIPIDDKSSEAPQQASVGVQENIPDRILLGTAGDGNRNIYWEFGHHGLANRHMLIFGASGMGKTYAIQCMLCEMAKLGQNSLIVDYTNGFLPNHLEDTTRRLLDPLQHVIRQKPLPINPFLPQSSDNGGILLAETANAIGKRIAGIFNAVYQIGDQQFSVLHRAVMDGVETYKSEMSLDKMLQILDDYTEDKKIKAPALTLHSKIRPFVLDNPFAYGAEGFNWDSLFSDTTRFCHIFQLAGLDMHSSRLVTEFILWDLYGYLQSKGKKTDPKVIVLDEVQNLDHQDGSPLSKYLREGRKFGLSLILATQTMSGMKKDERDRMFNADHKLFFKPADTELKAFAEIAAITTRQKADDWVGRLSNLKKGECYSVGPCLNTTNNKMSNLAQKITITPLEER